MGKFCEKCGAKLREGAAFCSKCGASTGLRVQNSEEKISEEVPEFTYSDAAQQTGSVQPVQDRFERGGNRKWISAKSKKFVIISAVLGCCVCVSIALVLMVIGCCIPHDWQEATCTEPKICRKCEKIEGEELGHIWEEATCTKPKICNVCGGTEGEALGHNWQEATCYSLKTCRTCGETTGSYAVHQWSEATCQELSTCSLCGETREGYGDHQWEQATCQKLATCIVCGETTGSYAEHRTGDDGFCTVCGTQIGVLLTNDNVQQYLSVKCHDNTIEITPCYSNCRYVNVNLAVIYIYTESAGGRSSSHSTVINDINVSGDGYGSYNTLSEGPGGRKYTATGIKQVIVGKDSYVIF